MKKKTILAVFLLGFIFTYMPGVAAAKVLPQFKKATKGVVKKATGGSSVSVSGKMRRDKRGIIVYFRDLNRANSVSYQLSYRTGGEPRGIAGTIDLSGKYSLSREFLFGTCSSGVCRYDSNISQAILVITSELKSGKRSTKRFKLKV